HDHGGQTETADRAHVSAGRSATGSSRPGRKKDHRKAPADTLKRDTTNVMTTNNMKAILVSRAGGPDVLELAELPVPQPKTNEAVVKVAAAGVNSIDLYFRDGRFKTPLPFVPGQEGAGVVTTVGSEAKSVKVGD